MRFSLRLFATKLVRSTLRVKRVDSRMSNNGGEDVLAPLRKAIQEQVAARIIERVHVAAVPSS